MATSRNTEKQRDRDNILVGLAAVGSAGGWEIAIDETTEGDERWFAQIEGPEIYMYFEVPSPRIIHEMLEFMAAPGSAARSHELIVSKHAVHPVTLVRDDEFDDRYFFVIVQDTKLVVRMTIGDGVLRSLVTALRQAKEDLDGHASD